MLKFTILLILFGVGGTAAYELSREPEPAPAPVRIAPPAPPVLVQRAQVPGGSDNHIISQHYAARHPGWRFQSIHLNFSPVLTQAYPPLQVPGESVTVYGTGPAGQGGPANYTNPATGERWWQLVGTAGNEETWQLLAPVYAPLP